MKETYRGRLERLRRQMAKTGIDLTVLGPTPHLRWLTGLDPHGDERPVMLFVSADYAGLLVPKLNVDSIRQHTDLPFHPWSDDDGPALALAELIDRSGIDPTNVAVSIDEAMRADFALRVLDALPGARRSFTDQTVGVLRAQKDEREYQALKKCALLNDAAFGAAFAALREGMTEEDLAEVIANSYAAAGARTEFISVCFGPNAAFPHHHTGKTRLKRDMAVMIDAGARLDGYPSDMTRMGWFGDQPSAEFLKVADVVGRAVDAAIAASGPGAPASDVDRAARDVIAAAGYGPRFLHRTGHGLGVELHEEPYISATSRRPMVVGNVFSIEPGIYLEGEFGVRFEEIVILRESGAEVLSEMPRAPVLCR